MSAEIMGSEKKYECNERFAKKECERALQAVRAEVKFEKEQQNTSCELYHCLENPFEKSTQEHAYIENLLHEGSERDPMYVNLFQGLQKTVKEALDKEDCHSFFLINCRFSKEAKDNFLLYVLLSWEA